MIIERDASYKRCSALLSAGGVRQQYSLPENIRMSMYSADFIMDYEKKKGEGTVGDPDCHSEHMEDHDIAFQPHGYLFLGSAENQKKILEDNNATQRSCGVDWIHLADKDKLSHLYPWLNTEDLILGSYSRNAKEGYFDPWGFMQCMKQEAIRHKVVFVEGQVDQIKCSAKPTSIGSEDPLLTIESMHLIHGKGDNNNIEEITGLEALVNCTGAWQREFIDTTICKQNSSHLTATQQESILNMLPIERRKRCIFYINCDDRHEFSHPMPTSAPLTIDPKGVYFRSEGAVPGNFICGVSPLSHLDEECEDDDDLEHVDHHLFDDIIWPTLAHRVPAFNAIKVKSAWSGFYDYNTFDQNAIVGHHPHFTNLICAGGFSGHGLQMAPATGRAVTELLTNHKFETLDLSAFTFERLLENKPFLETGIV